MKNVQYSKFRVEYKNIKGDHKIKYAYAINDLRIITAEDYKYSLSTADIEYLRDMEKGKEYLIIYHNGYATIKIVRL